VVARAAQRRPAADRGAEARLGQIPVAVTVHRAEDAADLAALEATRHPPMPPTRGTGSTAPESNLLFTFSD